MGDTDMQGGVPRMRMEFAFDIGDIVRVCDLQRTGRVLSIQIDGLGISYNVRYFDNAEAKNVWFLEAELGAA